MLTNFRELLSLSPLNSSLLTQIMRSAVTHTALWKHDWFVLHPAEGHTLISCADMQPSILHLMVGCQNLLPHLQFTFSLGSCFIPGATGHRPQVMDCSFFKKKFLEDYCFTMLCEFLLYNKMNLLYAYICPLSLGLASTPPILPL